jgi:hypothetical protein
MRVSGFFGSLDSTHVLALVALSQTVVGGAGDRVAVQGGPRIMATLLFYESCGW